MQAARQNLMVLLLNEVGAFLLLIHGKINDNEVKVKIVKEK
jgi:hypothetical protein